MTSLRVYRWCAQLRWPSSYVGKFLFTAFVGVHIPLIAMTIYVVLSLEDWTLALPVLIVGLLATLFGTSLTLLLQRQLLTPVVVTAEAIERYTRERTLPSLPTIYSDEAGRLMQNTQLCITHLDQLLTMKNDLLAVISHDTRAPLSNIVLASQMIDVLLKNPQANSAEIRSFNALIQSAAHRQVDLMNSLMSLARADTGKLDVQRSPILLRDLLASAIANNRLRAEHKGIHLIQSGAVDPRQTVCIDVAKTEQVLNNLIQNALKYTATGGTVQIKARVTGEQLTITVRDTGVGMDAAVLNHLFKPFTIERRSGTAGEPGSGLGLWICKTFTEIQGGTISVDSTVGSGTAFEVRLPSRIAAADSSAYTDFKGELVAA
jgi:signal transduction histidine kinase